MKRSARSIPRGSARGSAAPLPRPHARHAARLRDITLGVDLAPAERERHIGDDEIGGRQGHRGEPREQRHRVEPVPPDIDRQRHRLAAALDLHDVEGIARERDRADAG